MRVLIADDDPVYSCVLEDLLRKWRFEVVLAKDGEEVLGIMANNDPPKLILLDWDMPHVDGFEVATTIRRNESLDDTYILLITGGRSKPDLSRILFCGADDYLLKPFDPMDLQIHMRSALRILDLREEVAELKRRAPGTNEDSVLRSAN
jgi:two-component system, cell cycle response regulator